MIDYTKPLIHTPDLEREAQRVVRENCNKITIEWARQTVVETTGKLNKLFPIHAAERDAQAVRSALPSCGAGTERELPLTVIEYALRSSRYLISNKHPEETKLLACLDEAILKHAEGRPSATDWYAVKAEHDHLKAVVAAERNSHPAKCPSASPSGHGVGREDSELLEYLIENAYEHKRCDSADAVYLSVRRGIATDQIVPALRAAMLAPVSTPATAAKD